MDTGYLHDVHGIPPNDSIYAGRVVVYVLVVWAMATLDLMFGRTHAMCGEGVVVGTCPTLPMWSHGDATAPRGDGVRQSGW